MLTEKRVSQAGKTAKIAKNNATNLTCCANCVLMWEYDEEKVTDMVN